MGLGQRGAGTVLSSWLARQKNDPRVSTGERRSNTMQLYDLIVSIGWKSNSFNTGIANATEKINSFNANVDALADDVNKSSTEISSALSGVEDFFINAGQLMENYISTLRIVISAFDTVVDAVKVADAVHKGHKLTVTAHKAVLKIKKSISKELALVIDKQTAAQTKNNTATGAASVKIAALTAKTKIATAAKVLFNKAWKANPLGLIIAGIAGVVAGLAALGNAFIARRRDAEVVREIAAENDKLKYSVEELATAMAESQSAHEGRLTAINETTKSQRAQLAVIEELIGAEEKSADQREELANAIDYLNQSMEGLNLQYDAETGLLNQSIEVIEKQIRAREAQARAIAAQERAKEIAQEQAEVYELLSDAMERQAEISAKVREGTLSGIQNNRDLGYQYETLNGLVDELAKKMAALGNEYLEAVEKLEYNIAAMERYSAAAEAMSAATQAALDALSQEYQSLKDHATNMFRALSEEASLTFDQMIENMQTNQRVIEQWAENIAFLTEKGVDEGLLEILRNAGPESAGYVQELVRGIQDDPNGLARLNETFADGGDSAINALATSLGVDRSIVEAAANLADSASKTLLDKIEAANFPGKGAQLVRGTSEGINDAVYMAEEAVKSMCEGMINVYKAVTQSTSPSRVFDSMGRDTMQGLANGIANMDSRVRDAVRRVADGVLDIAQSTLPQMQDIGRNMMESLSIGISSAAARVAEAAMDAARQAVNGVQGFLGIRSPSRVFMEMGENTGQGFVIGIESMASSVERVIADTFGNLGTGAIQPEPKRTSPRAQAENTAAVVMHNTFYVNGEQDIDQAARQLARRYEAAMRGRGLVYA